MCASFRFGAVAPKQTLTPEARGMSKCVREPLYSSLPPTHVILPCRTCHSDCQRDRERCELLGSEARSGEQRGPQRRPMVVARHAHRERLQPMRFTAFTTTYVGMTGIVGCGEQREPHHWPMIVARHRRRERSVHASDAVQGLLDESACSSPGNPGLIPGCFGRATKSQGPARNEPSQAIDFSGAGNRNPKAC